MDLWREHEGTPGDAAGADAVVRASRWGEYLTAVPRSFADFQVGHLDKYKRGGSNANPPPPRAHEILKTRGSLLKKLRRQLGG